MTALLGAALLLVQGWCIPDATITAYVRTEYGPNAKTFDGTSIFADEPIAAASWNIPIDSVVHVEGLGSYRVADRGRLGSDGWIDVAMWTRHEAIQFGRQRRTICVTPPGG